MEYDIASLFKPSKALMLRLDMRLVDCPGDLSEMWTENKEGRRRVFTDADCLAVRNLLGRTDVDDGCFSHEYRYYNALQAFYTLPVFGHGSFILARDLKRLYEEVDCFGQHLLDLRQKVCGLLEDRYNHEIEMHRKILRFNPRVKLGTYLLTDAFVQDKLFQRAVEITCHKLRLEERMPDLLGI